ncbi:MAG: ABC transporter ATP-binding protein [Myxococcota bacterium]
MSDQEDPLHSHTDVHLTRRLLTYVGQQKALFTAALLLYPLTALAVILPPYLIREILDEVIPAKNHSLLGIYCAAYLLAIVLEYVTGMASQFAMSVLGQRAMKRLRSDLFAHVQRLPASFYDKNPIGRVLTRVTNDVEALAEVFSTGAVTVLGDLVSIAAVVGMMFWLDVKLTLFSFLVVPPLIGLTVIFRIYARRAFRAIRKHLARINTFLAEHIAGISVVQLFRQEERTLNEFHALNRDYLNANRSAIAFDALLFSMVEAIGNIAVAAMIWYGALDLSSEVIGAGTLVAFIHYIRRFFIPIRDLSTKYTLVQSAFAAAERVFTLLEEPLRITSKPQAVALSQLKQGLELRQVSFAYRTGDVEPEWVLQNVDLKVARGEKVALVGATGSGKTTILKLLNRTYDVQQGAVCIDGVDVRDARLEDVRRMYAVVLQDVYLFTGTIMDNMSLVKNVDEAAVRRAAQTAQADVFVERLKQGYDTPVKDLGANFSAGEKQLLAFTRALASDPEVLILDEATSNVDSATESRLQSALDVLLEGRTAVIVAHRLSTIRKVDRIVVLHRGRIVEQGSHEELLRRGGTYSKLAELHFGQSRVNQEQATAHY